MGQESVAWVLGYIAAFGLSDTLVAMSTSNPGHPLLLVYYAVMGLTSLGLGPPGGRVVRHRGEHGRKKKAPQ